ncbi:MAG: hypothetical protein EA412_03245 [Chitinophagaceae bacterium]|nr:MAG: hypothetical protein EA412_03245 [Chitinophagaceae bacterium]
MLIRTILSFFIITLIYSCNSNSFLGRAYIDTTSRYNTYFNASLNIEQAFENIAQSNQDNFNEILLLYPERNLEAASTYSSTFDDVIKRSSRAIQLRESSKWTDDHYLLIGKSYYMKGEFKASLETFQYIVTNFKDENKQAASSRQSSGRQSGRRSRRPASRAQLEEQQVAERQNVEEDIREDSFWDNFRHHAAKWEAMVWMVNTYAAKGEFQKANTVITLINSNQHFPNRMRKEYAKAKADFYIQTGNYEAAIGALEEHLEYINRNKNRIRPSFILAQLYERNNQPSNSIQIYQDILTMRPTYQFEFNANMGIARIASQDGIMSPREAENLLTNMLRESRNEEFKDQIYYALANLELNRNNTNKALEYLSLSAEANQGNTVQRAKTFLKKADIYYEKENYIKAQPNYEQALTSLSEEDENYDKVSVLSTKLKDLVDQIDIINEQDSLIYLASLDDESRMRLLIEKAENKIAEEEKSKRESSEEASAQDFFSTDTDIQRRGNQQRDTQDRGSGWYFYNQAAKSAGFNDFVAKWGNRSREDNWRRADKSSSEDFDMEEDELTDEELFATFDMDEDTDEVTNLVNQYLEGLPLSNEALIESENKVIEALYTKANLYRKELLNNPKSIETFERLNQRFPSNTYAAEVYYNLYFLYSQTGNRESSDRNKDIVLNQFPDSRYAQSILNPDFEKENKDNIAIAEQLYTSAYNAYHNYDFKHVIETKPQIDTLISNHPIKAKFSLLTALAIGKTDSLDKFIIALEEVKTNFPNTEQYTKADDILSFIASKEEVTEIKPGLSDVDKELAELLSKFQLNLADEHNVIIVNDQKNLPSRKIINPLAAYNDKEFSLITLQITPLILGEAGTMMIVKSFPNSQRAMEYYNKLVNKKSSIFTELDTDKLSFYVISDSNLKTVMKERNFENYIDFFQATYLK